MQTLRKKTSPCKYRNDPGRFFGDGVIFKAKLIGILEVGEARGDRMCQEALQDLKTAIRAAGEHKQRITINVTIDGLRLRDERTGDSLYHHPVHKISFIAQDMTDSRAFGYIFGSPESGHRFFGIKTDKAASQVVLAMRDLFQVVFELKKKEIELARQHIQSKSIPDHQPVTLHIKSALDVSHSTYSKTMDHSESNITSKYTHKEMSPESVADLVDLEQELSSIQRGITQMERITPIEPPKNPTEDDPFGDSFTQYPTYNLLPPPESSKSRHSKQLKPPDDNFPKTANNSSGGGGSGGSGSNAIENSNVKTKAAKVQPSPNVENWLNSSDVMTLREKANQIAAVAATTCNENNRNGIHTSASVASPTSEGIISGIGGNNTAANDENLMHSGNVTMTSSSSATLAGGGAATILTSSSAAHYIDAFSDLDPLGTGKIRPYIDKKYFFQDLKNPPKKVLKDLSDRDGFSTSFLSDHNRNATSTEFSMFHDKAIVDNNAMSQKQQSEQSDEFVAQFTAPSTQIFSPNNNGTHGTPPNLSSRSSENNQPYANQAGSSFPGPYDSTAKIDDAVDPFSPRVRKFDPFEDKFSKPNTFDFSFSKAFNEPKPTKHLFNGPLQDTRRHHENDSYGDNEIVPEPPPRSETTLHTEPPPLPPKKVFSDIIIRPRVTSPLAASTTRDSIRYASVPKPNHSQSQDHQTQSGSGDNPPSIPLPSRRIPSRADPGISYPGPGRPEKEVPLLLPPPKAKGSIKNRSRRSEESISNLSSSESGRKSAGLNEFETSHSPLSAADNAGIKSIPDITLSQLLTLGIDDLAFKLNVPSSKLNTMTIVELTKYLSDYIERSSQKGVTLSEPSPGGRVKASSPAPALPASQPPPPLEKASESSAVFRVSFDDSNDATFVAKFDDNFGLDNDDFIPNFDQFNQTTSHHSTKSASGGGGGGANSSSIDRYAVFREIIDQELQDTEGTPHTQESKRSDESNEISSDADSPLNELMLENVPISSKIDTKITEAISQAKDRYAALRDIILVEDLFEKPSSTTADTPAEERTENVDTSLNDDTGKEEDEEEEYDVAEQSSPDANISINLEDHDELDPLKTTTTPTISQPILSSKDDLEIDEYMNRAISNLSLDSRDHLSPLSKSATKSQNASTSPLSLQYKKSSPIASIIDEETTVESEAGGNNEIAVIRKTTLNDMSTSPIPLQIVSMTKPTTPDSQFSTAKSSASASLLTADESLQQNRQAIITTPSPILKNDPNKANTNYGNQVPVQEESWAVFDEKVTPSEMSNTKSPREESIKMVPESPCSSADDKADWKADNKKWRGHTSSSSRDLSPSWDDDEYRSHRSLSSHPDRHGFYMRHARRMNSCDDDYEYEDEKARRRERRSNNSSQNWYHPSNHRTWSPEDDPNCDHGRSFDRCSYERSTVPYEKRDKSMPYSSDRHFKGYEKRKYYDKRDNYGRPSYEIDDYSSYEQRARKGYVDEVYENSNFSARTKPPKDYFYDREKHSFDRDSTESFESSGRRRKSFGSGEMCGSFNYRDRYSSADRKRSLRKANKNQRSNEDDYEQDSDVDPSMHRLPPTETRSLQRRPRKSSGSSPWDGDDMNPAGQRSWKRPASASESERKLAENRRLNSAISGSDGEKDRRFFRKPRSRDRDPDLPRPYATMRYPSSASHGGGGGDDYEYDDGGGGDYDEVEEEPPLPPQFHDMRRKERHAATAEYRRRIEHNRSMETMQRVSRSQRDMGYPNEKSDRYDKYDSFDQSSKGGGSRSSSRREREFSYDDTPPAHPNVGSTNKFDFEPPDNGFESDFNAAPEKNLRFSTDFSDKSMPASAQSTQSAMSSSSSVRINQNTHSIPIQSAGTNTGSGGGGGSGSTSANPEIINSTPPQQKLRFDDKITVSKFDLFEDDDFSKAEFSFQNDDQWVEELPKKNNLKNISKMRHENIKKSESVNIFARNNNNDPFEDDDFFASSKRASEQNSNNFAKFDDNL